jgi:hypothetical protein
MSSTKPQPNLNPIATMTIGKSTNFDAKLIHTEDAKVTQAP